MITLYVAGAYQTEYPDGRIYKGRIYSIIPFRARFHLDWHLVPEGTIQVSPFKVNGAVVQFVFRNADGVYYTRYYDELNQEV